MKGDFSNWRDERRQNFTGVLHQQGRVLLDADWNAQTTITNDWQDTAAEDIIGAGVAAVPADRPNGFKVLGAEIAPAPNADKIRLAVAPGRVWADGLLAQLYSEPDADAITPVVRLATYLKPPFQAATVSVPTTATNVRDAVVLEVWREEMNAFQRPDLLIEPALGGPDTTERVQTSMAFRLVRLAAGESCESIRSRLRDDFGAKGTLLATLQPTTSSPGDCPTVDGGGYTGFEHQNYRIEIADLNAAKAALGPHFKWSRFGGGLVGRGRFANGSGVRKVNITDNPQAIAGTANPQATAGAGSVSFYLEAIKYDQGLGRWTVGYGAMATLEADVLTLGDVFFGDFPSSTDPIFFRLWDGIERVQTGDHELPNNVGIVLNFSAPGTANYIAGDYWSFSVRAGDVGNDDPLVGKRSGITLSGVPPKGIHYHRVALGVIEWTGTTLARIDDCRHIFQPLTRQATCCSYRVGDGMDSWGDFERIADAIAALPAEGGEICVLPGEYEENVFIGGKRNITIKGCGRRSRIAPGLATPNSPIFHVRNSQNIRIESLAITAHPNNVGVLLEGPDLIGAAGGTLRGITLEKLSVKAAERSAIEAHVGFDVTIRGCDIEMGDVVSDSPGIFFAGDDSLIAGNTIYVIAAEGLAGLTTVGALAGGRTLDTDRFRPALRGRGGIGIGGTSERVRVVDNLIQGGTGNGITLGTLAEFRLGLPLSVVYPGSRGAVDQSARRVDLHLPPPPAGTESGFISAGALHDIYIEHNRIYNMGANGIGVAGFFDLRKQDEFISVDRLTIVGNEIRRCLGRSIEPISAAMQETMGYGGIALADVEYLVVRDNVIENNGPSHLMPICGIYILHGEGIEISRNRILNNGANNGVLAAKAALPGARGGIYISYGIAPRVPVIDQKTVPSQNGVPAIKIHDNIVSTPLGQALALVALGPVSVVGNQFTSLGIVGSSSSTTSLAATVLIFNLGLSNELYMQILAFSAIAQGHVRPPEAAVRSSDDEDTIFMRKPGLDDAVLGGYLANGNVLFANNQCTLNLMDAITEMAVSSVLILSLDDVSFHGNQCDCDLFLGDLVITQAILFGISLRVTDNRFKEGILGAWLSAVTLGLLNITTDNQSTHCLLVLGTVVEDQPNGSLLDVFNPKLCAPFHRIGKNFGKPDEPPPPPPTRTSTTATATEKAPSSGKQFGVVKVAPASRVVAS